MLLAVGFAPHPPLLVPEIAGSAAVRTEHLRHACDDALTTLAGVAPERIVVLGCAPVDGPLAATTGSLAPYGRDVSVHLCPGQSAVAGLPLAHTIGAWLLTEHAAPLTGVRSAFGITADADAAAVAAVAASLRELLDGDERTVLLVMGDGSACRNEKAPGTLDPRALPHDEAVAEALRTVDLDELERLDPAVDAELMVAGRAPWQVAAALVRANGGREDWSGWLHSHEAPFGVGYLVAAWIRH